MNFKHSKNIAQGSEGLNKILSSSWSPNNMRLAIAQSDRKIALYDEKGDKKEAFSTKPFKNKNYMIRDIAFSPDSIRLAVAQSDNMVFVYKLGASWADQKKICNKLDQPSPVTCMIWPKSKMNELFIGLADGKVKIGTLKNNSSNVLYSTDSYVVSLSCSNDGKFLISGHIDGVIQKYNLENSNLQKMVVHPSIPYCLTFGGNNDILAAGNDYKVVIYNDIGTKLQSFDYQGDDKLKEFTVARASGDTIAVGNHNKYFVYLFNSRKQAWEEATVKTVDGLYSVTALTWKPDGSALVTGNLLGSVDLFEACLKKTKFKDRFEITYVTSSQIVVKNTENGKRLVIKPTLSQEIIKINIYLDNFIVMSTKESLVLGDLEGEKSSELAWNVTGKEKFEFNNPGICMIFASGELALVEFGKDEILGYCRTEYIHSNLISCRISQGLVGVGKVQSIKVIAYLIDLNTIYIQDLQTQTLIANFTHDSKIDFLELNKNGNKLIFRDRKRHLYLYNIFESKKITLLNFCGYVQWVPNSEVLVAQERKNVFVWYNVDDPDKVKLIPVKGEVEEVRRREGKTELLVEEGNNIQTYLLDDGLIAFSTAVDEKDLNKAVKILEHLEMNTETETHWKTLAKLAISSKNLMIAQRCYAAIGNYSKANYIKKVMKVAEKDGAENPLVEARLLMLDKQFNNAENLLLQNNLLDEAMAILSELQKWDESVKLAEKYNHPDIVGIKSQYYNWLLSNDQLDKAADMKEREGDFMTAISLYLQGGYPAKAANLVKSYDTNKFDNATLENIIKSLNIVGIYEKSGELLEMMGHYQRSLESYQQARCYSKAVEIARKYIPNRVERLEEEWGDYLLSQKHIEAAIVHFIEANCKEKAIEASIQARKWEKAIELCNSVSFDISRTFFVDIGNHFAAQRQFDTAEKYFLKAKEPVHAFNMFVTYNKWEKAELIIKKYMSDEDSSKIIAAQASKFEEEGKYKEAEWLYIMAGEHDIAISMFKSLKQYDNMLRLVNKYRPDFIKKTNDMVAQYLEQDKNFKQAEHHYIESGNWKSCVEMYRSHNMWEEALRVAKQNGSKSEINEIAKKWVINMPKDQAIKMLLSMGLGDAAIDILCDSKEYEAAFKLADQHARYKLPDVHFKYAMDCEDEKRYQEAEEHYIKANLVQEVIQMYQHIHEFNSSLRVARQHDPTSIPSIYMAQGKSLLNKKDYARAEMCFVYAKQPEYMVEIYEQEKNLNAALKFAAKYCPHLEPTIRNQIILDGQKSPDEMTSSELLEIARLNEEAKDYSKAIDTYLEFNEKHFNDPEKLEELWDRAVQLAWEFNKNRANDVTYKVAIKLKRIGKNLEAADLFERTSQVEEAVECYLNSRLFDKAKALVAKTKGDLRDKLSILIDRVLRDTYASEMDLDKLMQMGDEKALDILFQQGRYEECLEGAKTYYTLEIFNKFLIAIVKKFLGDKNLAGAADFLAKHRTPIYKNNLDLYKVLALEILAEENSEELKALKEMLSSAVAQLPEYKEHAAEFKNLSRLHKIAYYQFLKFTIRPRKDNFPKTYYRICLSVLAFGDIIKLDLALLDAGLVCRDIGSKGNAFILLNRYIDYYELIGGETNKIDEETELLDTDIMNTADAYRSEENIVTPEKKKEIHDWVVKTSIDKSVVKSLNRVPCAKCNKNLFEGNTVCKSCNFAYETCIVSGFPIHSNAESVNCTSCGKKALRECWKEWITAYEQCPWCKSIQMSY
jgi:intraflagellar transport protein 172